MEQELAQANANLPSEPGATKRVVNWGGVIKGVAIVGAVALVAAVAWPAFLSIGEAVSVFIDKTPALEGIAVTVENAAAWVTETATASVAPDGFITNTLTYIGDGLASLGNSALEGMGLAEKAWTGAEATSKAIALAGTGATVAVAAHAAMPAIQNTQLGMDVAATPTPPATAPIDQNLLGQQATQSAYNAAQAAHHHSMLHDAAHAAHHAAEEADVDAEANEEQHNKKNWASKFAHKAAAHGSYSEAVRANPSPRAIPQPTASFGEQIAADRANLEAALAK